MKKLDDKVIKCRFLAHEKKSIFRIWDIERKKVLRSAYVVFDKKTSIAFNKDIFISFKDTDPDEYYLYNLPANQVADVDSSERIA